MRPPSCRQAAGAEPGRDVPESLPWWFRPCLTGASRLLAAGMSATTMAEQFRTQVDLLEDDRFCRAMAEYIDEVYTFLQNYQDTAVGLEGGQVGELRAREVREYEGEDWAIESVDRIRFQWYRSLCPTALWNRRLEEDLCQMELEDYRCPAVCYQAEAREAAANRLSRSRTPQRRFPPNRAQDRRDAREEETDETGLMAMRHGRGGDRDGGADGRADRGRGHDSSVGHRQAREGNGRRGHIGISPE